MWEKINAGLNYFLSKCIFDYLLTKGIAKEASPDS